MQQKCQGGNCRAVKYGAQLQRLMNSFHFTNIVHHVRHIKILSLFAG